MQAITGKHLRFIGRAIDFARENCDKDQIQKMACILVKGGKIKGIGINRYSRSYVSGSHAEVAAIGSLSWYSDLKGAEAFICRLRKTQLVGDARPCDDCLSALQKVGIKKVTYTTNNIEFPIRVEKI